MALLHVLSGLRDEMNFTLSAVGVDHQLRPESKNELETVRQFCTKINVAFHKKTVSVDPNGNTQANAREVRYEALREVRKSFESTNSGRRVHLVMAHHAEDRAETILMKIIRGVPVHALAVMPACYFNSVEQCLVMRPMIHAQKRDVMLHIERKGIPYCEDPSNKNTDKYTRSKVRFDIMPLLREMNPNITDALCDLSDSASDL